MSINGTIEDETTKIQEYITKNVLPMNTSGSQEKEGGTTTNFIFKVRSGKDEICDGGSIETQTFNHFRKTHF